MFSIYSLVYQNKEIYVSRLLKSKICFPTTVQYIRIQRYMFLDFLKAKYVFQQFSSFIFFPGLQYLCLQVALCYKIQEKSKQLCSQVKSTGKNKQMSAPEQHKVRRHRKWRILCVHIETSSLWALFVNKNRCILIVPSSSVRGG